MTCRILLSQPKESCPAGNGIRDGVLKIHNSWNIGYRSPGVGVCEIRGRLQAEILRQERPREDKTAGTRLRLQRRRRRKGKRKILKRQLGIGGSPAHDANKALIRFAGEARDINWANAEKHIRGNLIAVLKQHVRAVERGG